MSRHRAICYWSDVHCLIVKDSGQVVRMHIDISWIYAFTSGPHFHYSRAGLETQHTFRGLYVYAKKLYLNDTLSVPDKPRGSNHAARRLPIECLSRR